jgi:hypothetical protein
MKNEERSSYKWSVQICHGSLSMYEKSGAVGSVADPHRKNADADPGKNLDADPDRDADADSCPY